MRPKLPFLTVLTVFLGTGLAQTVPQPLPQPAPAAPPIPEPRDIPYPGVIRLFVDATDINRAIFSVHETMPVTAGPMILLYPKWLPGDHAPRLPTEKLAGLMISGAGQKIKWRRDPVDMSAFHIDLPSGVTSIDIAYQYLSPISARDWPHLMTDNILDIWWPTVTIYPAGYFSRQIMVEASVKLPEDFKLASALETASTNGAVTTFKPTPLNTLVDSSVVAGRFLKQFDIDPGAAAKVRLDVFADRAEDLTVPPELIATFQNMVRQTHKLFASHHYDHYDFLVWLSDSMLQVGTEHHQSSEDGLSPSYFQDWQSSVPAHEQLAHEFTHSWNGKFRRPEDLWTPNFNVPMRDSLLWVYEGQTNYWGRILAARSGLLTRQQYLDALATFAAASDYRPGRTWRNVQDSNNDPIFIEGKPQTWPSWQRNEDYYVEGELIWLDVDMLIRERSGGKRSLDDFAKAFFGVYDGSHVTNTYSFDDVVKVLNSIQPYDWAGFLRARLESNGPGAPLDGLARGGYQLVYNDVASDFFKSTEAGNGVTDLTFSLGFTAVANGIVTDVLWDGPAFKAGLVQGMKIAKVNGAAFSPDALKDAVKAAVGNGPAVELAAKKGASDRTVRIDYHGGLRYPHLERLAGIPARLDEILTPLG
jgi:predicted metalloprotease with PDZ domain